MKLIVKQIVMILVATLIVGCSENDENTVLDEKYHLNILYGDIENYTGNDGQHDPNEGQKIIDIYRNLNFSEEDSKLLLNQGYPSMNELGFYGDLLSFCLHVFN